MENNYKQYYDQNKEKIIQSALKEIPCGSMAYADWQKVGSAIKQELGEDAFMIWDNWSQTDPERYKPGEMVKKWDSFNGQGTGGEVTAGTIFKLAQSYGWEWPAPGKEYSAEDLAPQAKQEPATFEVHIDTQSYTEKPSGQEAGSIRNRLINSEPVTMTMAQFASCIQQGYTFMPAPFTTEEYTDRTGQKHNAYRTTKQQLFVVDIDNDTTVKDSQGHPVKGPDGKELKHSIKRPLTIQKATEICKSNNLPLAMIYRTFSSKKHREDTTDPYDKFRLCFLLDKPLDAQQVGQAGLLSVRKYLLSFFGDAADQAVKDDARIVYGSGERDGIQYMGSMAAKSMDLYRRAQLAELNAQEKEEKSQDGKEVIKPVKDYREAFKKDMQQNRQNIRTGYKQLNVALGGGFSNDLYILGADTGTGKSAIACTLAQNIARQGVDVLYYALEMSRNEFIARGISMISAEMSYKDGHKVKYGDILNEQYNISSEEFSKLDYSAYSRYADEYYKRYGEHLYFIEGGTDQHTAREIAETVKQFKEEHGTSKIAVFIDYLQLLDADKSDSMQRDNMTVVSKACKILKALASQYGATVFAISSMANDKKNKGVTDASFKYSGDIGYTGGVLLGWNWQGVTDTDNPEEQNQNKKQAKEDGYRNMQLYILKYRNGERDNGVQLKYFPAFNYITTQDSNDTQRVYRSINTATGSDGLKARERNRNKYRDCIEAIKQSGQQATIERIADWLGVSAGTVKRNLREYGGYTINGQKVEPAGHSETVEIEEPQEMKN
jgi:replicative DNA helicase